MKCPKCNASMASVTFEEVTVDRCTECGGMWFDADEARLLKEKKGSDVIDSGDPALGRRMDRITNINCPRCARPMIRMVDVGEQAIDYEACSHCYGIFLDAGEFRVLTDWTMSDYLRGLFSPSVPASLPIAGTQEVTTADVPKRRHHKYWLSSVTDATHRLPLWSARDSAGDRGRIAGHRSAGKPPAAQGA